MFQMCEMKIVKVAAAVIIADHRVFATQRGYGDYKDGWEFPGGKVQDGETSEEAICREIKEELETEIRPGKLIRTIEYDYPDFHLSMDCFLCTIVTGDLVLVEHEAACWLDKDSLYTVDWLPADREILEDVKKHL